MDGNEKTLLRLLRFRLVGYILSNLLWIVMKKTVVYISDAAVFIIESFCAFAL